MTTISYQDIPYLDVRDRAFRPDSAAVRAGRDRHWCARTPLGYAVLRYQEATELLSDRRLRQGGVDALATHGIVSGPLHDWLTSILPNIEGADHTRLRRLVGKAFTRRAVDALRPLMRMVAEDLIDEFAGAGRCEFMTQFADPFPARIICELIGVPHEQQERFHGWANDLGLTFSPAVAEHRERIEAALAGLYGAVDDLIDRRRARPGDDLLSELIAAKDGGDRLSRHELRSMVSLLMFAGQDTTRHQLGLAMATFVDHPDQWRLLAERPSLAPAAVEEVMRVSPTAPVLWRAAAEPFSYRGVDVPAGTFFTLVVQAANTDPAVFGDGGFDITAARRRPPLTFGGGIHNCIGAALARADMAEALPVLARRLPDLRLDGVPQWRPVVGIAGPATLPLLFST
jgi:cytochrome P450